MYTTSNYHVFSLPSDLLETATPRNLVGETSVRVNPEPTADTVSSSINGARACNVCLAASFVDVDEQRAHFKSDWHRYNVKIRLNAGRPVTESDFAHLIEALEDSISGSASSSDESESGNSDAVVALMNKTRLVARSPSPSSTRGFPQTAITWFHSPPSTQIGVYKALFLTSTESALYLDELKSMQSGRDEGRKWAMFMVAGGHFAGAVIRVSRPTDDEIEEETKRKKRPKKPKPDTEVLKHKTFHRYTTRRKQGGSQSINDNAKGNAKSAGAQLRRYGEQALREDIRGLLTEWADEINDCERIWIRASSSNRKIFLDYDDAIILKGDRRLRTFPFPTRRPTQSELSRCLLELTKVKISHLTEDVLRAQDDAYLASLPRPKQTPAVSSATEPEKLKQPKLTREEENLREKWSRLLEMVNKGRLEPLKIFWEREGSNLGGVDAIVPEWTGERWGTLLQLASWAGHEDVTRWLLEDIHADPTIDVPSKGVGEREEEDHNTDSSDTPLVRMVGSRRTAYDLARSKEVRNVFRRCAAAYPEMWDWLGKARVPSVLSKEMEEEREEKKKVRRKGLKDRVKEREAKERERTKGRSPSPVVVETDTRKMTTQLQDPSAPRKLGGSAGASEGITGLTPEMRVKVERERRARAAEARLKALGGS